MLSDDKKIVIYGTCTLISLNYIPVSVFSSIFIVQTVRLLHPQIFFSVVQLNFAPNLLLARSGRGGVRRLVIVHEFFRKFQLNLTKNKVWFWIVSERMGEGAVSIQMKKSFQI